jgi:hypothetical protein
MTEAARGLRIERQFHRRAHLVGNRDGDILQASLVRIDDALEQCDALFARGLRERLERRTRGLDGCIDVLGRAEQDLADRLFGRRIDDIELAASRGADPRTVDEKLSEVVHERILRSGRSMILQRQQFSGRKRPRPLRQRRQKA